LHSQIGLFATNTFWFGNFFGSTHRFHDFGYHSRWISPVPAAASAARHEASEPESGAAVLTRSLTYFYTRSNENDEGYNKN